ncbi:hypothetical protein [Streptomyces eurythermus]|uniref:hypothetical protein n=1 Tax=Streptomyces eurythermus TaxID=42237 RepID=UPI0036F6028C
MRAVRLCWALSLNLPARYVALEKHGHRFKQQSSLAEVVAEAARIEEEEGPLVWTQGYALRRHVGEEAAADYLRRLALDSGRLIVRAKGIVAPLYLRLNSWCRLLGSGMER